jgi:uncharacterized protein YbjT (DUF2867 family)
VFVDDVAAAVGQGLALEAAQGRIYELGGPRTYTYKELLRLVLEQTGRRRALLPVPYLAWDLLAALMAPLPRRPISRDQVVLMRRDNVVGPGAFSFADLGLAARAPEDILPGYLGRREPAG